LQIYVSLSTLDMHLIFQLAMRLKAKAPSVLLLCVLVCGIAFASWLSAPPAQAMGAGCPVHQQLPPSHSPVDHSCCQSGHDAAVPQKLANPRLDMSAWLILNSDSEALLADTLSPLHPETVSPGTPPSILQLRI
jgi:hypothetical protein